LKNQRAARRVGWRVSETGLDIDRQGHQFKGWPSRIGNQINDGVFEAMMEAIHGRRDTEFLFEALQEAAAETEAFSFSCAEWFPGSLFTPVKISCSAFARRPASPAKRDSTRQARADWALP